MNYKIETIPHYSQRYNTVGDFYYKHMNEMMLKISDFSPAVNQRSFAFDGEDVAAAERLEFCVLIHELCEAFLCHQAGIKFEDIDAFDLAHEDENDPGSNIEAPYHSQHMLAAEAERFIAQILNVDWEEYENAVSKLVNK